MGAKGWGAYPVDDIPAGTFVAEYVGEVLPVNEAKRRVPAYDRDGLNYVLTTQEFFQRVRMCVNLLRHLACGRWLCKLHSSSISAAGTPYFFSRVGLVVACCLGIVSDRRIWMLWCTRWGGRTHDPYRAHEALVSGVEGLREPRNISGFRLGCPCTYVRDTQLILIPTSIRLRETFEQGKQVCQTIVDATTSGNESRFFNHSCDPNLSVFVVSTTTVVV